MTLTLTLTLTLLLFRKDVRGVSFSAGNRGVREVFVGGHFSSELFRQFAAESAERSPDVRRSPPKNIFGGRPADPCGTGRSSHGFARIRGGSCSAAPIADNGVFCTFVL